MSSSMYLFYIQILFYLRDVKGDIVEIDEYSQAKANTSCKKGLIHHVDQFILTARINADRNTLLKKDVIWILYDFKIPHSYRVGFLCALEYKATCSMTDRETPVDCYCKENNNTSLEIQSSRYAEMLQSEGKAFVEWSQDSYGNRIKSRKVTLPVVYAQEQVSLIVGKTEVVLSNCTVHFETKDDSILFCVYNLLAHTLKLSLDYDNFESNENCIRRALDFTRSTSNSFNLSYVEHEGCERHKNYTCRWNAPVIKEGQRSTNGGNTIDWKVDGWTGPMMMMICFHVMVDIGFLHLVMI